jgi:hypothetical protein
MRNKQAADAGATQQAARNQELQDTMLLVASLLAFFALVRLLGGDGVRAASVREASAAYADGASRGRLPVPQVLGHA